MFKSFSAPKSCKKAKLSDKSRYSFLLMGYYGQRNTGDDIMTYIMVDRLNKIFNYPKILIKSGNRVYLPANTRQDFFSFIIRFKFWKSIIPMIKVLSTKALIIGGGGLFHDPSDSRDPTKSRWHNFYNYYYTRFDLYTKFFNSFKGKTFCINVSVGPLNIDENRKMVQKIFERCTLSTFRDTSSEKYFIPNSINHINCFDAGVLIRDYVEVKERSTTNTGEVLGVSLINFNREDVSLSEDPNIIYSHLTRALNSFLESNPQNRVKLFDFHGGSSRLSDVEINRKFIKTLKGNASIVPYNKNPLIIAKEISKCDRFIGTRLHSCIFSYALEVPFLMINYHEKCKGFADMINLHEDFILSAGDMENYSTLSSKFKGLLSVKYEDMDLLPYATAYKSASYQFELIKKYLESESDIDPDKQVVTSFNN